MPWKETSPMRERTEFIVEHRSGLYSFSALCEKYQISRKTGYKFEPSHPEQNGRHERFHRTLGLAPIPWTPALCC